MISVDIVSIEKSHKTPGLERKLDKARKLMMKVKPNHMLYTFIVFYYDKTLSLEKLNEFAIPLVQDIINKAEAIIDETRNEKEPSIA
jgi:hypothetical protein